MGGLRDVIWIGTAGRKIKIWNRWTATIGVVITYAFYNNFKPFIIKIVAPGLTG